MLSHVITAFGLFLFFSLIPFYSLLLYFSLRDHEQATK